MIEERKLHELEPYVKGIKAIHVPATGIVNFKKVAEKMAEIIQEKGGQILLDHKVESITEKTMKRSSIQTNIRAKRLFTLIAPGFIPTA